MLYTSLHVYDPALDCMVDRVQIGLEDETLKAILDALERGPGVKQLEVLANNGAGDAVRVVMTWSNPTTGFFCRVDGFPAGHIHYDELKGAYGKPCAPDARTLSVCLSSEVDIWRRGVLDPSSGMVSVYTAQRDLAYLGADAYLLDVDQAHSLDSMYLKLEKGEPSIYPLRVPFEQLLQIRPPGFEEATPQSAEQESAIDSLQRLISQMQQGASLDEAEKPKSGQTPGFR